MYKIRFCSLINEVKPEPELMELKDQKNSVMVENLRGGLKRS